MESIEKNIKDAATRKIKTTVTDAIMNKLDGGPKFKEVKRHTGDSGDEELGRERMIKKKEAEKKRKKQEAAETEEREFRRQEEMKRAAIKKKRDLTPDDEDEGSDSESEEVLDSKKLKNEKGKVKTKPGIKENGKKKNILSSDEDPESHQSNSEEEIKNNTLKKKDDKKSKQKDESDENEVGNQNPTKSGTKDNSKPGLKKIDNPKIEQTESEGEVNYKNHTVEAKRLDLSKDDKSTGNKTKKPNQKDEDSQSNIKNKETSREDHSKVKDKSMIKEPLLGDKKGENESEDELETSNQKRKRIHQEQMRERMRIIHDYTITKPNHPGVCFFHLCFKVLGVFTFIFLGLIVSSTLINFLLNFTSIVMDFWITKNISGRYLVGLRWWNEIDEETGEPEWYFESYDYEISFSQVDSNVFWWGNIFSTIFWGIMFLIKLLGLNFLWGLLTFIAAMLNWMNLWAYFKCSRYHRSKISNILSSIGNPNHVNSNRGGFFF